MPNIPNTTAPNLVLTSVGNGSNASRWSSSLTSLPSGTTAGQIIYYNGTTWVTNTAPTAVGDIMYWDASAWVSTIETPTANGQLLYWSQTGLTWKHGVGPGSAGQMLVWSGSNWTPVTMNGDASINYLGIITLANVTLAAGTYGDATHVPRITFNSKGLITNATSVAITSTGGITQLTGDVTAGPGSGSQVASLNHVYPGFSPVGSSTQIPVLTIGSDGRITSSTVATPSTGYTPPNAWSVEHNSVSISNTLNPATGFTIAGHSGYLTYLVTFTATMYGNWGAPSTQARAQLNVYYSVNGGFYNAFGNGVGVFMASGGDQVMVVWQNLLYGLSGTLPVNFTTSDSIGFEGLAAITTGSGTSIVNGVLTVQGVR